MTTNGAPKLPSEIAADLADPGKTVTEIDPKRPPVHQDTGPGWWARSWDRVCRWALTVPLPCRHRHFYQLIGAYTPPPGLALLTGTGGKRATVLAYRCMCHRADQHLMVTVPGEWTLDDLVTPDWPGLMSVARAEHLGALGAVRKRHGDDTDTLLDPVRVDWQYIAGELAGAFQAGNGRAIDMAMDKYRHACRIEATLAAGGDG